MTKRSELYLLFSISNTIEIDNHPPYLNRTELIDNNDIDELYNAIEKNYTFFSHENYYGYFDSKNLDAYLYPITVLGDDYYPFKERAIRSLLNKWGEDWRKTNMPEYTHECFNSDINDDTLSLIAEKKINEEGNTFLILDCNAIQRTDEVNVKFRKGDTCVAVDKSELNIKKIASWLIENRRPERLFRLNPKHGENGIGMHRDNNGLLVSPLKCSKDEATTLLKMAIGENERTLYFWDDTQSMYIEFKKEEEHIYHGFHINDINRVPKKIIEKIDQLK